MKNLVFYISARKFLEGTVNGNPMLENPGIAFTAAAKAGEYDSLTDPEYNECLEYCEEMSKFWNNTTKEPAAKLLMNLMQQAKADKQTFTRMAIALYESYAESDEKCIPGDIFIGYVSRFLEGLTEANKAIKNPSEEFRALLTACAFKDLSPKMRTKLNKHCDLAAIFWKNKGMESSARLLENAMEFCSFTDDTFNSMIYELMKSYENKVEKLERSEIAVDEKAFIGKYIEEQMIAEGYWSYFDHYRCDEEAMTAFREAEKRAKAVWDFGLNEDGEFVRERLNKNLVDYFGSDVELFWGYVQLTEVKEFEEYSDDMVDYLPDPEFDELETFMDKRRGLDTWSPKEIYNYVKKQIYGQEEAVKAASMLVYNHVRGHKRNVLFAGPTGCGKTEIWRVLRNLYGNIRIIDSTRLTMEGWRGEYKLQNLFDGLTQEEAEQAILVFDEFDKMCEPKYGGNGTNYSKALQNELLKFIEGTNVECQDEKDRKNSKTVNTSKVSFVFCGSFENMMVEKTENGRALGFGANIEKRSVFAQYKEKITQEDLAENGNIRREICGRINQIVQLRELNAEDYEKMLDMQSMSPLAALEKEYSLKLRVDDKTRRRLASMAAENRMGVRYIYSTLQQLLDDEMFEEDGKQEYSLCMGE